MAFIGHRVTAKDSIPLGGPEMNIFPDSMLSAILLILASICTAAYVGLMGFCIAGAFRLSRFRDNASPMPIQPSVSVIVPLRNEEDHAPSTLRALAAQDYPGWFEVICINDRSTDGTQDIITSFSQCDSRFSSVRIPDGSPPVASPKKRALAEGFSRARGEILMTTDADCLSEPGWIRSMAGRFGPGIGIVQGPKRIRGDGSLLSRYQEHEVFGLVSVEAASFALGNPMVASAPSLAYRKELYEAAGGFEGLEGTVSGDDDMLVRKMQKIKRWKVTYNPSPDACVSTSPVKTWSGLLSQRARWASNGAHYEEKGFVALLAGIYGFY